jgi:hypothetical protein
MITFIDEPDPDVPEQEEEDTAGLISNNNNNNNSSTATNPSKENTDTLSPMYEPPVKREHFIFAHPTQPRSVYSMPHHPEEEDSGLDPLTPENHEARWRRQNRITSYKEITWPTSTSSANVLNTQDRAEALHLEKRRNDMRRLNARYYMQQTGRAEQYEQW